MQNIILRMTIMCSAGHDYVMMIRTHAFLLCSVIFYPTSIVQHNNCSKSRTSVSSCTRYVHMVLWTILYYERRRQCTVAGVSGGGRCVRDVRIGAAHGNAFALGRAWTRKRPPKGFIPRSSFRTDLPSRAAAARRNPIENETQPRRRSTAPGWFAGCAYRRRPPQYLRPDVACRCSTRGRRISSARPASRPSGSRRPPQPKPR